MSTDLDQPSENTARLLVVRIPSPSSSSSADSPLNSSPTTSILAFPNANPSSSSSFSSSPTRTPTTALNVRFAPLPDLSKRKKRYHQPLGVAARSEIMRRRKAAMEGTDYQYRSADNQGSGSSWGGSDAQNYQEHRSRPRRSVMGDEEEELLEDPFLTLGRIVKGASKSLWRKVSHKRIEKGDGSGVEDSEGGKLPADGVSGEISTPQTDNVDGSDGQAAVAVVPSEIATSSGAIDAQRERNASMASRTTRDTKRALTSIIELPLPLPAASPSASPKNTITSSLRRRSMSPQHRNTGQTFEC